MALSRTQVDKLGERLRKADVPSDDDLRLLDDFRQGYRGAKDGVGATVAEIVGMVPGERLKTTNSIVDKLRRETVRLSQIQDIAGLRVVRDMSRNEQDFLVQRITARISGAKVFDRRAAPSHGYRAVHVIVQVDDCLVEVQVRTALQHGWALLIERFASAWGQQVKYGGEPDEPESVVGGRTRRAIVAVLAEMSHVVDGVERGEPIRLRQYQARDFLVAGPDSRFWAALWMKLFDDISV